MRAPVEGWISWNDSDQITVTCSGTRWPGKSAPGPFKVIFGKAA
jgi:hypothetical protein